MYSTIQKVDSLFIEGKVKTSDSIFRSINPKDIKDDNTKAYYYLMKTTIDVMKDESMDNDSLMDFCVKYYEKTGNDTMMARAYYYKGIVLFLNGKSKEALYYMKKAEAKEEKAEKSWLINLIYSNLSYINDELGAKKRHWSMQKKNLNWQKQETSHITFVSLITIFQTYIMT